MTVTTKPLALKPGLLVALRTTITGGIEYQRKDLDANTRQEGEEVTKWETTRVIADKAEHERAVKVRGKASSLIGGACLRSAFGLVCLASKEEELDAAYREALALVDAFNESATVTRISVNMLKGRIAESDEIAAQAIGAEVRDLIDAMKDGLARADVGAIRESANKARSLGQMLDEGTADKVGKAIEEARSAARAIVKRVETGGEDAALVIQELSRRALDEARFAFLDLDGGEVLTSAPAAHGEVDLVGHEEPLTKQEFSDLKSAVSLEVL